jgi:DNA-directed RNA polymerase specialized sigma24 family protein
MTRSDSAVVAASLGEPAAFGELFDRHARVVHAYVARRLGADRADDVTAETFRIAFEQRSGFDIDRGDVRPWLLGIATNLIRRQARSEERRLRALGRLGVVADCVGDPAVACGEEISAALLDIDPGDRDVVLLVAWEDLSYQQVAAALDIPVGTVRSRLHRARQQLRARLHAHLDEENLHG